MSSSSTCKANNIKYVANQAVRAAEQLPLAALPALAKMKDGQAMLNVTPTGAQVVVLAGSRAQAVDEGPAGKAIEQFLLNERKRKIIADDLKALRASAKIAYVGKFAASAPVAAEVVTPATAADVAASGRGDGARYQGDDRRAGPEDRGRGGQCSSVCRRGGQTGQRHRCLIHQKGLGLK